MRMIRCAAAVIQPVALGVEVIRCLKACNLTFTKGSVGCMVRLCSVFFIYFNHFSSADLWWDRAHVGPITVKDYGFGPT